MLLERMYPQISLCARCSIGSEIFKNKFGFSLDLDNFLTLKNANIFVFSSLNRNFTLSLTSFEVEDRLHLGKTQINLVFLSIYTIFAAK